MGIKPSKNATVQTVEAGTTFNVAGILQVGGVSAPASVTLTPAAAGANVSEVTITVKDGAGVTLPGVFNFDLWLSDAASGAGLTATTASGAVAAKASSGADLGAFTAKKALRCQTLATGVYTLSITDSSKTGFYVCASVAGRTFVSAQLSAGSYG
jgi:hypothetical protein